ncbi:MAG: tRNA preQ1(34) S-adenosylmethionine ribosyltransferase-isomerase QueA [Verrucomicrobia bacterium]|nr:tRNA preQ1(34) S-adenosylmethionine ribosyltransferase-isomerase QueA [Verrucomicrobiota bacterium]
MPRTDQFDYDLPPELIAQEPAEKRDASRMLVLDRATGELQHRSAVNLPEYLRAGDLLILNDTRVIPARIFGRKEATGGKVEFLILEEKSRNMWEVLMRSSRRPAVGSRVLLADGKAIATVIEDGEEGRAVVQIASDTPLLELLDVYGITPLPPYIHRSGQQDKQEDRSRYQTVYAREPGAVAAPTAGLHFTESMFTALEAKGVATAKLTLHVGIGTFKPVTSERVEDHQMESERYVISDGTADAIRQTKERGGRVIAVGSTSVRTLEASAGEAGEVTAGSGRTNLFIYPPYEFRIVDAVLTNFHLPKSTLIMMMSAFAGRELIMSAYEEAVRERYRFFSYGDCMLIL